MQEGTLHLETGSEVYTLQTYVDTLNNRPRKKLAYRTSAQDFQAGNVARSV